MYFNFFDRARKARRLRAAWQSRERRLRGDDAHALLAGRQRALPVQAPGDHEQRRDGRRRHALRGARADGEAAHDVRRLGGLPREAGSRCRDPARGVPQQPASRSEARPGARGRRARVRQQRRRAARSSTPRRSSRRRTTSSTCACTARSRSRASRRDRRSMASGCATTPGARATGRPSTPTAGSRSTSRRLRDDGLGDLADAGSARQGGVVVRGERARADHRRRHRDAVRRRTASSTLADGAPHARKRRAARRERQGDAASSRCATAARA